MSTPHVRLGAELNKRGVHLTDVPCPICQRSADLEASDHVAVPVCMNPSCIYQRALVRVGRHIEAVA